MFKPYSPTRKCPTLWARVFRLPGFAAFPRKTLVACDLDRGVYHRPMNYLRYLFLAAFMATALRGADVARITPEVAAQKVAEGKAVLVDVREPAEWKATGVAAPAVLLPKSDFDGPQKLWAEFLEQNRGKEIILYCHSGRRAAAVAAKLAVQGVNVANAGGFADWKAAGLPTRKIDP